MVAAQDMFTSTSEIALTAAEEVQHLTKKIGENVTFDLGAQDLKHDDQVVWSHGAGSSVIYDVSIGEDQEVDQLRRFHLSLRTGSLTIHALSAGDSDVYLGQIINGRGSRKLFNLTVEGRFPGLVCQSFSFTQHMKRTAEFMTEPVPSGTVWFCPVPSGSIQFCLVLSGSVRHSKPSSLLRYGSLEQRAEVILELASAPFFLTESISSLAFSALGLVLIWSASASDITL
ncbi:hypothetical protein CCH79_00019522 [Gambusia affinis]|uniref:Immunoglobulin subtype domain-containing protein n=1 Tax=Gambusia affinis TaxID=33528 RepID=A0A315W1J4_GAMAF|nr:hypothetical protein CCH79_00019522 [Gambusia affinis]